MARVTYSPLIVEMSGKCADAVFSRWKGIDYVRSRVVPANPKSDLQVAQRNALKHTLTLWQSVKAWAKSSWNLYAKGYALSGYNRYMEDNILLVKAAEAGVLTPYNALYAPITNMAFAAGGAGEITATWDKGSSDGSDSVYAYYHKLELESEVYAWSFHGSDLAAAETITIDGLDTGQKYEVAIFCGDQVAPNHRQQSYNEVLAAG